MITLRYAKLGLAAVLAVALIAAMVVVLRSRDGFGRTHVTAYFASSNGVFVGDDVRILGVPVGKIDTIEALPERVRISFWFDDTYRVPADAKAVLLSPSLVTARAIQLTPAYAGGAVLADNAVIPRERTAVPVEWDEFRDQLKHLTQMLQPTTPGGVSPLGELINTTAENLRGQGSNIRDAIIEVSQAMSALGDHSSDIFSTVRNLSILVSALRNSDGVLRHLNQNLAAVSASLADDPQEIANAVRDLNAVAGEVTSFAAENKVALGTTSDKLASVSQALNDSLDDVKQLLHVAPTAAENIVNIYQPAQGTFSGALATSNLSDPISFVCSAIQAASRLGAEQSAKLCVQYLAPIVKNRQYNFFPLGENLFVGASARPNEITYSEDWMRPDNAPPQPDEPPPADLPPRDAPAEVSGPAAAQPGDPRAGLPAMLLPPGPGS